MFVHFTRTVRLRSAGFLAALYVVCVLAPSAAFAFGDGSRAAHCLTEDHHGLQSGQAHMTAEKAHVHADGTSHVHSDAITPSKDHHGNASSDGQCCGLFCFSALPASDVEILVPSILRGPVQTARIQGFVDHLPPRLFRPPLSPLPV